MRRHLVAAGRLAQSDIAELDDVVTGKAKGRSSLPDLTVFKSLGIALEDVAVGALAYQRVLERSVSRAVP